jgi:hypothetical protein
MEDEQEQTLGLPEAVRKKLLAARAKSAADASTGDSANAAFANDDNLTGLEVAGRYVLSEKISQDETYVTFRAAHKVANRSVNIKFLRVHLLHDTAAVQAFRKLVQAQSSGRQSDPAGSCADFGVTEDGRPYAVYIPAD